MGAGSLGYHHIRILRAMREFRFAGFHETDAMRAERVQTELQCRAYDSIDALLTEVDAVTVVVPTSAHYAVAMRALEAGKHVFIEKPITSTIDEADALLSAAEQAGLLIQIGHVERFNRAVRAALEHVQQPRFIESERLAVFSPRGSDVAVVLDLMIHDIDLLLTLMGGAVKSISAVGVPVLTRMIDIANARVTFESGAVANITSSRISRDRVRKIRIFQHSGYISLDLAAGTGEFFRVKERAPDAPPPAAITELVDRVSLTAPEGEPLRLEFESFAAALNGSSPVVVSGEEGRRALEVALRIVGEIERSSPALEGVTAAGRA